MTTPTEALMRIVRENYGCERARCVHPTEESCQCYAAELLLGRVQAEALEEAAGLVDDESPILAPSGHYVYIGTIAQKIRALIPEGDA